jgi:HEAT repeat protein
MEPAGEPSQPRRTKGRLGWALALGAAALLLVVARPGPLRAAWRSLARVLALTSDPVPASPPRLSDHEVQALDGRSAQEQAELLLARAVNHYEGANEQIAARLPRWRGQLRETDQFRALLKAALDSNDLRVRAASLELYLAIYDLAKNGETIETLAARAANDPAARPWAFWMLGCLGNRGVEPQRVAEVLLTYVEDPETSSRRWAVEGLGLLAGDEAIEALLAVLHDDPSPAVRERAACNLAQSGMFRKEQRLRAVPRLVEYAEEGALDATTRGWVFQALRDITGARLADDAAAWREWENGHPTDGI